MIEVLFGDSEAASMKAAKNKVVISTANNGPTSVWIAGKKRPPEREGCGWIEGMSDEVVCLGFLLDIGDIREDADSVYRRKLIYAMYAQGQWGQDDKLDEELRNVGAFYGDELGRLKRFLEEEEAVRVWYSTAPYSMCGFYHLCSILWEYGNEVRVVKLPEYIQRGSVIQSFHNWGEVAAEEFAGFLSEERALDREMIRLYAGLWGELREDNRPLRAVVNGRVVGVPDSFYDFLIWKRLTKEPVKEARLIGDIMGNCPIGVGDWWYAKRIEKFIGEGKIKVTEDSKNKYARLICLKR